MVKIMENVVLENNKRIDLKNLIFKWILPLFLILVFIIRLFSYTSMMNSSNLEQWTGLKNGPLGNYTLICLITITLQIVSNLIIASRGFFNFKTLRILTRIFVIPSYILGLIFSSKISFLLSGKTGFSVLLLCLILEASLGLIISGYYFIIDFKEKINFKELLIAGGIFILLLIPAMPNYFPQMVFGLGRKTLDFRNITPEHRLMLYVNVVVPVTLYFSLRNKGQDVIRFTLIYISCAVLAGFMEGYDYHSIVEPWAWPFHLCNTALFIIPLCLIFKFKRLFYFTYFINVLGAFLAMLMPNYGSNVNIMSMRIFTFWYNHWIAFFMPLLIVALKVFDRPKIKEFIWSMVWFLAYFIIALFFNVYFTGIGHEVDYFFMNSDFIADKLGRWAENLFKLSATITINGKDFVFHPIYQILFFLVYVVLGLGVWFIYSEFFRIADNHYKLHTKLQIIKQYEYANSSIPPKERREEIMNSNPVASLVLKNFSKKYSTSKVYSVHNASFEVHAGEIFGFLGPNGAGKSTIIKSIVGIQQITDGNIEVCGYDVKADAVACKYNIGYVPDHYALYEKLTGREYINYIADIYEVSNEERNERLEKYLRIFEMEGNIDSKIRTYSHGMKQKITIMAALVHNPKVWILDEPLTGLDPNSIYQVKECMKAHAAEGNIVFFSSHLIDIVEKLCQRIAIIKHGEIQCVADVEDIEKSGISLEQYYLDVIGDNSNDPRIENKVNIDEQA